MGSLLFLFWYTAVENEQWVEILWQPIKLSNWIQEQGSTRSMLALLEKVLATKNMLGQFFCYQNIIIGSSLFSCFFFLSFNFILVFFFKTGFLWWKDGEQKIVNLIHFQCCLWKDIYNIKGSKCTSFPHTPFFTEQHRCERLRQSRIFACKWKVKMVAPLYFNHNLDCNSELWDSGEVEGFKNSFTCNDLSLIHLC